MSKPAVNFLNFIFPFFICCFIHAWVTTCFFRSKLGKIKPVAFPLRPRILFLYSLVPGGADCIFFCMSSSVRDRLSRNVKNLRHFLPLFISYFPLISGAFSSPVHTCLSGMPWLPSFQLFPRPAGMCILFSNLLLIRLQAPLAIFRPISSVQLLPDLM